MALTITGWSFDQPVYTTGGTITLTIDYTSTDATVSDVSNAVQVTVTDSTGTATQISDGSVTFPDFTVAGGATSAEPTTVTVADNRVVPGVWTQVSNVVSGTASPFAGVAVFTSVA